MSKPATGHLPSRANWKETRSWDISTNIRSFLHGHSQSESGLWAPKCGPRPDVQWFQVKVTFVFFILQPGRCCSLPGHDSAKDQRILIKSLSPSLFCNGFFLLLVKRGLDEDQRLRVRLTKGHSHSFYSNHSTRIMGNHMAAIDRKDVVLRITKEGGGDRYGCWVIILLSRPVRVLFYLSLYPTVLWFRSRLIVKWMTFHDASEAICNLWAFHSLFHSDTKPLWKRCRFGNWLEQPRSKERNFQRDVSSPALAGQSDVVACD